MRTTLALLLLIAGCQKAAKVTPAVTPAASASAPGWEVRYNAALALANRGSERAADPAVHDLLLEMLSEPQQLRNFRATLRGGQEVSDETAARLAVISALKAVAELHRRQPAIDLKAFREPVAKLTQSDSGPIRAEAAATRLALDEPKEKTDGKR